MSLSKKFSFKNKKLGAASPPVLGKFWDKIKILNSVHKYISSMGNLQLSVKKCKFCPHLQPHDVTGIISSTYYYSTTT